MSFRTSTYRPFDATFPEGVRLLLIVNAAAFVLQFLSSSAGIPFTELLGLRPADVLVRLRLWQPLTYMFLHGGFFHLFFNLLVLWMMGSEVERFWGKREFLRYYLTCGLGAAALAFAFAYGSLLIGASGAVFGVMVAFALMFPDRVIYLWFVVPVPAKVLIPVLVAMEFLFFMRMDGIAHFAHVGGALTGFLYMRFGWRDRLDPSGLVSRWRRRRLRVLEGGRAQPAEEEIDRILDKISRSGLASLTPEESRLLEEASRRPRGRP
ncbi:MAG: rhomboid family intramembrane serine protease [Gemmatimonadetes bacterium]|nr:rhomboid family intramembrane serine protease [Gemmatimonadota bacterium]